MEYGQWPNLKILCQILGLGEILMETVSSSYQGIAMQESKKLIFISYFLWTMPHVALWMYKDELHSQIIAQ